MGGSRMSRNDGAVRNTEPRDAADGQARVDDVLIAGHHGGRAARVHVRLQDVVLGVIDPALHVPSHWFRARPRSS